MTLLSGPPYGYHYPPEIDGATAVEYQGFRVPNIFDIKRQIFERENANFRTLQFFRDTSKELLSLLSTAQILGEDLKIAQVPIFYANYERAIAKLFKSRNLTLPVMSLAIADTEEDADRRRPNYDIEFWTIKDEKTKRYTRVASLAPKAVNVSYQLYLWARYTEDMNQLVEYVMAQFRPHLRIETNFNTNGHGFITAVSDNSTVTAPDREDRVLRKTVTINVESYMPTRQYMIQSNGAITEMNYETTVDPGLPFDTSGGQGGPPAASATENLVIKPGSGTWYNPKDPDNA
tara:strand:- start:2142 stop:3011 length:870 start_codon:yes stop_codon:yes gene_type:complete